MSKGRERKSFPLQTKAVGSGHPWGCALSHPLLTGVTPAPAPRGLGGCSVSTRARDRRRVPRWTEHSGAGIKLLYLNDIFIRRCALHGLQDVHHGAVLLDGHHLDRDRDRLPSEHGCVQDLCVLHRREGAWVSDGHVSSGGGCLTGISLCHTWACLPHSTRALSHHGPRSPGRWWPVFGAY